MKGVSKLRSHNYSKVIEFNIPIRFYWVDNKFDGMEIIEYKLNGHSFKDSKLNNINYDFNSFTKKE